MAAAKEKSPALPYGCATCGRVLAAPDRFLLRGPEVIVQGVRLATCATCLAPPEAPEADQCDGRCMGQYATELGTYYELRWRPSRSRKSYHGWSCWDIACVEAWAERSWLYADHEVDYGIFTVVDGKRRDE